MSLSLLDERMESGGSHKLFLKYHISTFYVCSGKKWYTSGLIMHIILLNILCCHHQPRITLKCYISAALSQQEKWCDMVQQEPSITTDLHISKPYLSKYLYKKEHAPTKSSTSCVGVILGHSHQIAFPKVHDYSKFRGWLSQPGKWKDGEQRQPSIVSKVLHTFYVCPGKKWYTSGLIMHILMEYTYNAIIAKNHTKMLHFSSTLNKRNGVIWCNESHPLQLTYLKTLIDYLYKKAHAYEILYQPCWCHTKA